MTRMILAATVAAGAFLAVPMAQAGGIPTSPPPAVVPVAPAADWSGFYGGVQLEFGRGDVDYGAVPGANFRDADIEGNLYGIFFGYRHDYGNFVLGTEFDYMTGSLDANLPGITSIDRVLRATLELGIDAGNAFVYGTAGVAGVTVTTPILVDDTDYGGVFGIGVDYRLNDRTTVGAELLQHQVNDFNGSGADVSFTTLGINIGFQF